MRILRNKTLGQIFAGVAAGFLDNVAITEYYTGASQFIWQKFDAVFHNANENLQAYFERIMINPNTIHLLKVFNLMKNSKRGQVKRSVNRALAILWPEGVHNVQPLDYAGNEVQVDDLLVLIDQLISPPNDKIRQIVNTMLQQHPHLTGVRNITWL